MNPPGSDAPDSAAPASLLLPSAEGPSESVARPSALRAWVYLIWLSWQRQARAHLMVWIALGLLAFMTFVVFLITPYAWDLRYWRYPRRGGQPHQVWVYELAAVQRAAPWDPATSALNQATAAAYQAVMQNEEFRREQAFLIFSRGLVFVIFTTFLLPLWSISFATEALGREREQGNLLWLLTRPLSRPAVYLAKYVAVLPWCLALNLGGFAVLCLTAGEPGRRALAVYWPAVLLGTLAFCALFHLLGAWFRRAAIVAILYAFFFETLVVNFLPGHWRRASISYYTQCLMADSVQALNITSTRTLVESAVGGTTAALALVALTVLFLGMGMVVFARREYLDLN